MDGAARLDGQLLTALAAAGGEHAPATLRPHPRAEAVLLGAMALLGLVGLLGHVGWFLWRPVDQARAERPWAGAVGGRYCSRLMSKPPGSATIDDFDRLDIRVGRILEAAPLEGAHKPAYRLLIDFGTLGRRRSSAQLVATYPDPDTLIGRLVIGVVNFPPRRIAGFESEVLVLGALPGDGRIPLLGVDEGAAPGDPIG